MKNQERIQADLLAEEGKSLYQAKKYPQAADSFSRAAIEFAAVGMGSMVAEMRNNQCVSLLMAKKPKQALKAVQGTSDIFIEVGKMKEAGMALANEATALKDLGDKEAALESFSKAGEIFKSVSEEDLYLQTMQSISSLKLRSRNVIGAIFSMQNGLDEIEKPSWRQRFFQRLMSIFNKLLNK
jgi:tetratricopeptide (TPR) repeat protein